MSKYYKGDFFDAADFDQSEWQEYYVYRVEVGELMRCEEAANA